VDRWQLHFLWVALFAAFAPVCIDLYENLLAYPVAQITLVSPILIGYCLFRGIGRTEPRRLSASALVLLGATLEFLGIAGESWSIARLGLPVAFIGLARWNGAMSLEVASLAFWILPIPDFVFSLTTPNLESALLATATAAVRFVGIGAIAVGPIAHIATDRIELHSHDTGILLAALLAQFGWFVAVCRHARPLQLFATALGWALLSIPGQFVAVVVALVLVAAGWPEVAEAWLVRGVWLTVAVGALIYIHVRNVIRV
jgi:hypothetical protein